MAKAAKKTQVTSKAAATGKRGRVPAPAAQKRTPNGKTPIIRPQPARPPFKRDLLAALLVRSEGATIAQMQEVTGWLPHTVRAALTGLRKRGYIVDHHKVDNVRIYRAAAPE